MRKSTRFQIAKRDIVSVFERYDKDVLYTDDISRILEENRDFWRLPQGLTRSGFVKLLVEGTSLRRHEFGFPQKNYIRFTWGEPSVYRLALSLERDSYLTHYTALYWHNLTDQVPKTIYVNHEQAQKRHVSGELLQGNIERAFRNPQRESSNIGMIGDFRVCILNGRQTGMLGVTETRGDQNERIRLTDVERTLIDITVRPAYSGGIYEVVNAYRRAANTVSINKVSAMLRNLNYIYPYHQAIGFYLERSGAYREAQIGLLKSFAFEYDFYLTHGMKETEYSREWRLYYPKGF